LDYRREPNLPSREPNLPAREPNLPAREPNLPADFFVYITAKRPMVGICAALLTLALTCEDTVAEAFSHCLQSLAIG
jgi:hypothetical protein